MKRAATISILAAVLLGLLTVLPAPTATAKPTSQCIYMVKQVRHHAQYPHHSFHTFAFVMWEKSGNKIKGIQGGFPSSYERHRLTYQPAKNRAAGKQENWITGRYHAKTFTTVGKDNTLRVKGYKRVSKAKVQALMNAAPLDLVPGTRCY